MLLHKLKIKSASEKGAMDRVLVTLLFVVVGVVALVGLEQWTDSHKDKMLDQTESTITNIINE